MIIVIYLSKIILDIIVSYYNRLNLIIINKSFLVYFTLKLNS